MSATPEYTKDGITTEVQDEPVPRQGLGKIGNIFACGTALFSDGYQNGVVGEVNTILRLLYPREYTKQKGTLFSSMGFAGTVIGMLVFGYISDKIGRRVGMLVATLIVAVFAALAAGAYSGGSISGMLNALIAYRFLIGIGIGAEYPAGSVAASENTEDPGIKKGTQHMLFVLATNCAIDWGFVIAAFVPLVMIWIFGLDHLRTVWRMSLGFGVIPPLLVLVWRMKMSEPRRYQLEGMRNAPIPYWLIWKRYWKSFVGLSTAWFIYDFISYPFGIYSSSILEVVYGDTTDLRVIFGWNVVINLFYIPGCMLGALLVDRVGPKTQMVAMLLTQAVVGFIMSGLYSQLIKNIAAFVVVYGLFLSFGEAGPGDCLGLIASKSWPTAIRGQAYGLAAAIGKLGAFVGTYAFPAIIARFPAGPSQSSGPFFVGSGLAVFSAIVVYFLIPEIPMNHMTNEDAAFRAYLEENGYDTSLMGLHDVSKDNLEEIAAPGPNGGNVHEKGLHPVDSDEKASVEEDSPRQHHVKTLE